MAKSYKTIPIGYQRVDNKPLESNTLFKTFLDAENYALKNPTAYEGQIISVLDPIGVYIIQKDLSLISVSDNSLKTRTLVIEVSNPATPMTIVHDFGRNPTVIVVDDLSGKMVTCSVIYPNLNQVKLSWKGDFTGQIYLI